MSLGPVYRKRTSNLSSCKFKTERSLSSLMICILDNLISSVSCPSGPEAILSHKHINIGDDVFGGGLGTPILFTRTTKPELQASIGCEFSCEFSPEYHFNDDGYRDYRLPSYSFPAEADSRLPELRTHDKI